MNDNEREPSGRGRGRGRGRSPKPKLPPRGRPPVRTICPTKEQREEEWKEVEDMMRKESDDESVVGPSGWEPLDDALADVQSTTCVDGEEETSSIEITGRELPGAAIVKKFEDIRKFKLHRSRSPGEFYLIQDGDQWFRNSKEVLNQKFQRDMKKNELKLLKKKVDVIASPTMCYAYQEPFYNEWCRVRLLKIVSSEPRKEIGLVYLFDMDVYQFVPVLSLRSLPERYAIKLVPIIKSYLHNVLPIGREDWSTKAVKYFNDLVRNKKVHARVADWTVVKPSSVKLDAEYCLGVDLFVSTDKEEMISVRSRMIEKEFAVAINV